MNIATIIIVMVIVGAVYLALRTLKQNCGNTCSGCKSCAGCKACGR
ncbi:MAG: hypothetical protein J5663_03325 [Bacteroidaceae bacterium]|nr:hypothetical protein [Bacteroidaceae bacterium]